MVHTKCLLFAAGSGTDTQLNPKNKTSLMFFKKKKKNNKKRKTIFISTVNLQREKTTHIQTYNK